MIGSFPALAQDSAPMSFSSQQAVEYAIKNNVNIINADLETEISQARVNELIGIGLPQVKGNIDINDISKYQHSLCHQNFLPVSRVVMRR